MSDGSSECCSVLGPEMKMHHGQSLDLRVLKARRGLTMGLTKGVMGTGWSWMQKLWQWAP